MADAVRWGILGTANIAARAFLPAMREAGGQAVVVGSRSRARGAAWAADNQVGRSASYEAVLADPQVQAVYIALPNDQHVHWAGAALEAGKVVLCEKPMALDAAAASGLLAAVPDGGLLWESFVFPFHPQTALITGLMQRLGDVCEIISEFHFQVGSAANIRLSVERGGGALYDVGCYPLRLGRLLFGAEPVAAAGGATFDAVDRSMAAVVEFPAGRLLLSAGLDRPPSTFTRIIGAAGELRVTNPFHPRPLDTVELILDGASVGIWPAARGSAFLHAITHIQGVISGDHAPHHLAGQDALAQAVAMDLVRAAITDRPSS